MSMKLSKGDLRREQIMTALKAEKQIEIPEIMRRFGCSEATARRDLNILAEDEKIIRTLGGAYYEAGHLNEASFQEKENLLLAEKTAIAAKVASLVEEGDIVGLTGGTTTYLIAKELRSREGITVVTNAANIAVELAANERNQIILTGGVMRGKSYECCGPMAEMIVKTLNIGKMFVGIDGIHPNAGLTTYTELEAEIDKLMINRSAQVYAVFDHTKVNKMSLFPIVPISKLDACITNRRLDKRLEEEAMNHQVRLHYTLETERS